MTLHLGDASQRHLGRTLVFFRKLKLNWQSANGADQKQEE
jgi:hypothetical protein